MTAQTTTAAAATVTGPLAPGALRRALGLFGDQWTMLVLQSVFLQVRRFSGLRARLGVADSVLSARLRTLLDENVLTRAPYRDDRRVRHEYRLTERGLDLWSLLVAIWAWERVWVPDRSAELPELYDLECGESTLPQLACGRCGLSVTARDTAVRRPAGVPVGAATVERRFRRRDGDRVAGDPLLFFPETMELLGDRWGTAVLAAALLGIHRFADFERELGVRPSVLADKLRRMTEAGVLAPTPSEDQPGRLHYRLADKGMAFFPVFALLIGWATRWLPADGADGLRVDHRACSAPLASVLRCSRCGRDLQRHRVRFAL